MYTRILTALDGSVYSDLAGAAALQFASMERNARLIGCHAYAAAMHSTRFDEMEPGLPQSYQEEETLTHLRTTHEGLITEGMKTISDAYLDPIAREAQRQKIPWEGITPEGRNYVELLRAIRERDPDLVVLGACGHGQVPESGLGSLAERTLLYASSSDLLLIRKPLELQNRPIVIGIDGSPESFGALHRALEIAKEVHTRVDLVAVFDPYFHSGVFHTIAGALPEEKKKRFNFEAQEKLHDEIIDRGLEKLYEEKLLQGTMMAKEQGVEAHIQVLKGKVFPQLHRDATLENAGLLVVGRWGLHREPISLLGSNTLNLARICTTNLLVVTPPRDPVVPPTVPQTHEQAVWTTDGEEALQKVPEFARGLARKAVEQYGREKGLSAIDAHLVREVASRFGMNRQQSPSSLSSPDSADAEVVVLKKIRRFAPDFHRHILKSRIMGQTIQKGTQVLVYNVEETQPAGVVRVTERTRLEFR